MAKRSVFEELREGYEALKDEREGKITLRTHTVSFEPVAAMTAQDVIAIRRGLNVSQAVFASYLRINKRTVEGWEQGRSKPNPQAALLMKLVEKYPEALQYLAAV